MPAARWGARCGVCVLAWVVLVGVSAAWAQPRGGGPPPARVVTDPVRLETLERWREVTGELRAPLRSVLASQQAGLVVQLNVEAGDRIDAGKVIAKLDDRAARLEVSRAEATVVTRTAMVTERRAAVEKARRDLERFEVAFNRSSATQSELDDARTAVALNEARLAQAQADVTWAEADLALARKRLDDMTIRAPFSGVVTAKRTETGEWVDAGGRVAEIVSLDAIDAWLDVPERYIARLREQASPDPSASAVVRLRIAALGGDEMIEAPISGIIPAADPLSRLFPVRARIDNRGGRLKPGMSVVGLVPSGQQEASLTVSKDAVLRGETGPYVYFDAGGVAAIAPITIIDAAGGGTRLVVSSPMLRGGMEVVVEGNERLFPGQPLLKDSGGGTGRTEPGGGTDQGRP